VLAVLRENASLPFSHANLGVHPIGLRHPERLVSILRLADVVVHAAAALRGDWERQQEDTVLATAGLLAAMREAGPRRLVGISSFSVYDYSALTDGSLLDERAPIAWQLQRCSIYARAKIEQERLFRAFGATILRPGIVYSQDRLWNHSLGRPLGSRGWLLVGPDAQVPLVHVDDVAQAILLAAARDQPVDTPINLVEDAPPHRWQLINHLNGTTVSPRHVVRLPWTLHRKLAGVINVANRVAFAGRLRLPGLLDSARIETFKPLRYDNGRARDVLGWRPKRHAAMTGHIQ
jgi:nucleoside-diphosphate-sugar epimerase